MRVLYANHTAEVSGAERSLLDLLAALPPEVIPQVACPNGRLAALVGRLGISVSALPATDGSLRLHPWFSARALAQLAAAGLQLRQLARAGEANLIHANSIRMGLAATVAAKLGAPPVLVHVRDCLPTTRTARAIKGFLGSGAAMLIANSQYTANALRSTASTPAIVVIHNPVDLDRFNPDSGPTVADARRRLGLERATSVLAVIGQIAPWKAQADAVRCFARVHAQLPSTRLLIVGTAVFASKATRYDNVGYLATLRQLVSELSLEEAVMFLGEREDIPEILRATDVLLVPSWEEPFGRTVVEAMAMAVPVVATNIGGTTELIRHDVEGLLLPPRRPEQWAAEVTGLLTSSERRLAMGRQGRARAIKFGRREHAARMMEVYREVLSLN